MSDPLSHRDDNISYCMELLFSSALITQYTILFWFNSWVAEVMVPKETTVAESHKHNWESNLEPCNYLADALAVCYCVLM